MPQTYKIDSLSNLFIIHPLTNGNNDVGIANKLFVRGPAEVINIS